LEGVLVKSYPLEGPRDENWASEQYNKAISAKEFVLAAKIKEDAQKRGLIFRIDQPDQFGRNALMNAIRHGEYALVFYLFFS
jgi:hypothetical protein